jgi:hypothetical protein
MTDEKRAVAPDADSVAVEIDGHCLVLDADAAADLRGRIGLALGELRAEQAAD